MEIDNVDYMPTFTRKYPSGCGNFTSFSSSVDHFRTFTRDFPPGCGPNAPKYYVPCLRGSDVCNLTSNPSSRLLDRKSSDVRNLISNPSRPVGVKGSDVRNLISNPSRPVGVKGSDVRNLSSNPSRELGVGGSDVRNLMSSKEMGMSKERKRVLEMLRLFREKCDELSKMGVKRVDIDAYKELNSKGKLWEPPLAFGSVPGVEIGDKFNYRAELRIVGLHRLFQGGIDSMEYDGVRYTTCIVANEGHMDRLGDPNVLSYIGEGGTVKRNSGGVAPDQPLTGGNLALSNSRKKKMAVRVVRGLRYGASNAKIVYVYDGLYEVTDVIKKKGPQGNMIFEFLLTRNPGQPAVQWSRVFT